MVDVFKTHWAKILVLVFVASIQVLIPGLGIFFVLSVDMYKTRWVKNYYSFFSPPFRFYYLC